MKHGHRNYEPPTPESLAAMENAKRPWNEECPYGEFIRSCLESLEAEPFILLRHDRRFNWRAVMQYHRNRLGIPLRTRIVQYSWRPENSWIKIWRPDKHTDIPEKRIISPDNKKYFPPTKEELELLKMSSKELRKEILRLRSLLSVFCIEAPTEKS